MEKYHHIYHELKKNILDGKYSLGYRFPVEPELAEVFRVSRMTLRKAMKLLEQDHLIERFPRRGTFVTTTTLLNQKKILAIVRDSERDISEPRHSILPGVEEECRNFNLELICASIEQIRYQQCYIDHENFIGIILADDYGRDKEDCIFARQSGLPVVCPHDVRMKTNEPLEFATISRYDDAILEVLRHLLGMGHKRILTLANKFNGTMRSIPFEEYLDFICKNGGDGSPELIRLADFRDTQNIIECLQPVFSSAPPTAIVCYSDFLAMIVYSVLKKHNIIIPRDVAVTGFGGYPGSALFNPPLTTVDQHYYERGKLAVRMLLEARNWNPRKKPFFRMNSSLVIRESSNKIVY